MHSNGKGMSASALPYKRSPPSWCKTTSAEVTDLICKLARKGMTPSSIGVKLRDEQGIPQVHIAQQHRCQPCLRPWGRLGSFMQPKAILVGFRPAPRAPVLQVKSITGAKILRILKGAGLAPEIPEDLYHLIKKIGGRQLQQLVAWQVVGTITGNNQQSH
jgi:hypothetical protein